VQVVFGAVVPGVPSVLDADAGPLEGAAAELTGADVVGTDVVGAGVLTGARVEIGGAAWFADDWHAASARPANNSAPMRRG
jgi:hypothetical protein